MMFQMLQTTGQYSGAPSEDPHLHLRQFLDVSGNLKVPGVTDNAFRLRLFPYSLRDRAKSWLNSLEPNSIATWNDLAEKFLAKYFPPSKNAKMRNETPHLGKETMNHYLTLGRDLRNYLGSAHTMVFLYAFNWKRSIMD